MNKLLTIGIAVYNIKEEYLRSCLKSAAQSFGDNIEIMVIDDCSREYCAEICREYCTDSRIVYIRNERNMGISTVRNMMIERASGEWLMFVDGDDMLSQELAKVTDILQDCGRDLIIFNNRTISGEALWPISEPQNAQEPLIDLNDDQLRDIASAALTRRDVKGVYPDGFRLNPALVTVRAYRTEFLRNAGLRFDGSLKIAEDSLFSASVLLARPRAAICRTVMYYYRLNQYSVMHRYNENSKAVTDAYIKAAYDFIVKNMSNDREVNEDFIKYRCVYAMRDNFELNIFHRDNPKSYRNRKKDFSELLRSEPYRTAIESVNHREYSVYAVRLIVGLAQKKRFFMLDMCYRHDILFKLYGGIMHRINDLKGAAKGE